MAVIERAPDSQTVLLHTRLSIIDLDVRSNQPMGIDGNWLAFNGEIYNYREVRDELILEGVKFSTDSDTEVLLRGIQQRGWTILNQLEGMWAFAFYQEDTGVLTLCRDRFGEKPLWIRHGADGIFFASEVPVLATLSGVPNAPDLHHLRRFLVLGYKSLYKGEETFVKGVSQVPPGVLMRVDPSGAVTTTRYWTPSLSIEEGMSFHDAVGRTRDLLLRSVDLRLRADVPLAFSLSGGVDSVALASLATAGLGADVHGFTIMNTDPRYEERMLVEEAVRTLGIEHTWVPLSTIGFLERLRGLVATRGEPLLTLSSYVQSLLMEQIGSHGYKVVVGALVQMNSSRATTTTTCCTSQALTPRRGLKHGPGGSCEFVPLSETRSCRALICLSKILASAVTYFWRRRLSIRP